MGARTMLAGQLKEGLPEKMLVVPDARAIDTLSPKVDALIQVVATEITPANTAGQLRAAFEIWVLVPFQDPAAGEDKLEDALDSVLELLASFMWFEFVKAERSVYREQWISYKVTGNTQLTILEA